MTPEIIIPLVVMSAPVAIVLITLLYRYKRTTARYQALIKLAEKGIDLSPQLLVEPQAPYSERRRALVLIGSGLGLIFLFLALPFRLADGQRLDGFWALGLLPLCTGLGYLASWWLNTRGDLRDDPRR